mmetsp:Transcript_28406/g.91688  ORF Transcript_28406/g.91688 Transcript_28406/m.91688 type:complete len:224 (-) Transcript_28406:553-1224(-)
MIPPIVSLLVVFAGPMGSSSCDISYLTVETEHGRLALAVAVVRNDMKMKDTKNERHKESPLGSLPPLMRMHEAELLGRERLGEQVHLAEGRIDFVGVQVQRLAQPLPATVLVPLHLHCLLTLGKVLAPGGVQRDLLRRLFLRLLPRPPCQDPLLGRHARLRSRGRPLIAQRNITPLHCRLASPLHHARVLKRRFYSSVMGCQSGPIVRHRQLSGLSVLPHPTP